MAIKSIVSDLYGVNLHRDESVMVSDFQQVSGRPQALVAQAIQESGRNALKLGQIQASEYVSNLNARLGTDLSVEQVQQIWNRTLRVDYQMLALLESLEKRDIRVVLLSNLNVFDWADAAQLGFAQFEAILSYQVGLKKPDPRIFALAPERTGLSRQCHLYIDDQDKNVQVACAAGMLSTQFTSYQNLVARLEEHGLSIN
jgi:HAD superfamily hydrolase (TIGR01509 family)